MEVIEEQISKTTYVGNCPNCGKVQKSTWGSEVDTKCQTCIDKEYNETVKNDLMGAEIINIKCDSEKIESIILKKPGKPEKIKIEIELHWEVDPELIYTID